MTRVSWVLVVLAAVLAGCDRPTGPDATDRGSGLQVEAVIAAGSAALDSGRIIVHGPTERRVKVVPGSTTTIDGLAPGTYTVVLEGFQGDGVSHYGLKSGVQVTKGQNSVVTVTLAAFRPSILTIPTYTVDGQFTVTFSEVASATGYRIEWDSLPDFSTAESSALSGTSTDLTVDKTGPYYVRVRAIDPETSAGRSSEVSVIETLTTVVVTPPNLDTLIGVSSTVQFLAQGQDAKANLFAVTGVTWSSSDETVATIDGTGLLTVNTNGTTTITATEGFGQSGATAFKSATVAAVQVKTIPYSIALGNTPMALTWDGTFFYMIADGSPPSPIVQFAENGDFVAGADANIDARSLVYSPLTGKFYAKIYGTDWLEVTPGDGGTTLLLPGIFTNFQAHPALARDTIYEHADGTVRVLDLATGQLQRTIEGLTTGSLPASVAIATDDDHLFTWDGTTVFMYDLAGRFITSFGLSDGHNGYTLSYANGLLWSTDAAAVGTWFGYQLVKQ